MNQNGTVQVNVSEELLRELRAAAREVTDAPDLWLQAPHEMFRGRSPLELASVSPKGKELVLNLIGMIKDGMFT